MSANSDMDVDYYEPYNCNEAEPFPDSVVYQPIFEDLKTKSRQVVYMLHDVLAASPYQNKVTKGLLEEAKKRLKENVSDQTMFAVSGDMASGKSSVINSILGIGTIARKGDGGGSCTWVVQRFTKQFPNQDTPFAARVSFYDQEQIRTLIISMFIKYYRATHKDTSEDSGGDGEEEFNDIRTVLDAFMSLFCDRIEFEDEASAREYLRQAESEDDAFICGDLTSWALEVAANELEGNDFIRVGGDTPDELLLNLQPYTYLLIGEEGKGQVSPWPLVSVIEFGFDNQLLNQGIVLVDAPGLSDSNSTRANNAILHHRECTHKITVAPVNRARDDKSLRDNLKQGFYHRGSGGTLLALTYGDSIDPETDVSGSAEEKAREMMLKVEIKRLREHRQQLSINKRKATRDDIFDFDDEIREVARELKVKTAEFESCRVLMRNTLVLKAIQAQYRDMTRDPKPLSAFVVGNEAYKAHQAGHAAEDRPVLSVQKTGIPSLRRRLYALPAEAKLNSALHMANTSVPNLVTFFDLYCSKTHLARKAEIEAIILLPKKKLGAMLGATLDRLNEAIKKLILDRMMDDESDWVSGATQLCRSWASDNKSQLALMRNEGCQKGTRRRSEMNWNRDLLQISKTKDNMERYFADVLKTIKPIYAELIRGIQTQLDATKAKIRGDQQLKVMGVETFLDSFVHERKTIVMFMNELFKEMRSDIGNIQQDAMVASPSAHIAEAMRPIYTEVIKVKGRGGPDKRSALFQKKVARVGGVWMAVHNGIERDFSIRFGSSLHRIEEVAHDMFDNIHKKFDLMCDDTVVKDPTEKAKEDELRKKLEKQLVDAKKLLHPHPQHPKHVELTSAAFAVIVMSKVVNLTGTFSINHRSSRKQQPIIHLVIVSQSMS
ncbi:hypothetical protein DOTSEDRAFT_69719 [Dothistroma septosporum NZE10]|uniref:Uncharacterized protein n=1 Tax=Dothistroma septosporum (strain NZE10 / CBS 128990) TaxID=675120 RepID=N1Q074_DOTSN|nr:hypothetical protein DOTSEDRAFT_69719 [Dothistroma septosporum NZE10]